MDKDRLIAKAAELTKPSTAAAGEYGERGQALASAVTSRLGSRPDLAELIGPDNVELMADNHANHVLYMESVFHSFNPGLFVETLIWVVRTYLAHGFSPDYWRVQLPLFREAADENLSAETVAEIEPFYRWLEDHLDELVRLGREEVSAWERGPARAEGSGL